MLVILRHGESTWNQENLFTGWHDVALTARGEQEAGAAGAAWPSRAWFDVVHTSLLTRAIQTAERALAALGQLATGAAVVATERAPLRRAPGPRQGGHEGAVRPRAVPARGAAPTTSHRRRSIRAAPSTPPTKRVVPAARPGRAAAPRSASRTSSSACCPTGSDAMACPNCGPGGPCSSWPTATRCAPRQSTSRTSPTTTSPS